MDKLKIVNIKLFHPILKNKEKKKINSISFYTDNSQSNQGKSFDKSDNFRNGVPKASSVILRKKKRDSTLYRRISVILSQVEQEKQKEKKKVKNNSNKAIIKLKDPNLYSCNNRFKLKAKFFQTRKNLRNKSKKETISDYLKKIAVNKWNSLNSKMITSYQNKSFNQNEILNNLYTTPTQINKAVIRDFSFKNQAVSISKKNLNLTEDFLERRKDIFKKRASLVSLTFEKVKNNEIDIAELAYGTEIIPDLEKEFDLFHKISQKEYQTTKENHYLKTKKKIVNSSKNYANLLLNVSKQPYEKVDFKRNMFSEPVIYYNNLERGIKVHYLRQNNIELDNEEKFTREKYKKIRNKNEEEISNLMKNSGVPNFVKKKFRSETIKKFREVNGDYM